MKLSRHIHISFAIVLLVTILATLLGCSRDPVTNTEEEVLLGDINLDGTPYDIADVILLSDYFLEGPGVFVIDEAKQIAATDANHDGITVDIADLVFMALVITGQVEISMSPQTDSVHVTIDNSGEIVVHEPIGAAYVVVKGDVVPTLLADSMRMSFHFDGVNTSIFVRSQNCNKEFSGSFLLANGDIVSIQLATSEGGHVYIIQEQVHPDSIYVVQIAKVHNALQGVNSLVDVTVSQGSDKLGGFDLLIAYNASALTFYTAHEGDVYDCGWEYFNYRYDADGNCGDSCPSGLIRVVGVAETNNGPYHPDYECVANLERPFSLFTFDFFVSNDRTLEGMFIPIRFFWGDCADNSIAYYPTDNPYPYTMVQGVSRYVIDYNLIDNIEDSTTGFATYTGVQTECLVDNDDGAPVPIRYVDFINGGIDIISADSIDPRGVRGDINLNGNSNEVADAVLFSDYFVHGLSVFTVNTHVQIDATDVNSDGTTLSLADLVYMIRIITGDALPFELLSDEIAGYSVNDGVISISKPMGAVWVTVEGNVTPVLLADNMDLAYAFDGTNTRILVKSFEIDAVFCGDFLVIDGDIISIELATYEGAMVLAIRE